MPLILRPEEEDETGKLYVPQKITYAVTDSAGNTTRFSCTVYIVDTTEIKPEYVTYRRYISEESYKAPASVGGLEETSIWRRGTELSNKYPEYADYIDYVFSNEYRNPVIKDVKYMGITVAKVEKAGTGQWDHVDEVWYIPHEGKKVVDEWIDTQGYLNYGREDGLTAFRQMLIDKGYYKGKDQSDHYYEYRCVPAHEATKEREENEPWWQK